MFNVAIHIDQNLGIYKGSLRFSNALPYFQQPCDHFHSNKCIEYDKEMLEYELFGDRNHIKMQ